MGCTGYSPFFSDVHISHYLIYHMWLCQADSYIILSLDVDPKDFLQVSLNLQDQLGSLEILNDLIYILLVSTIKYQVFGVQGVHHFSFIKYTFIN